MTITEARKILGTPSDGYPDEFIEKIISASQLLKNLFFYIQTKPNKLNGYNINENGKIKSSYLH